MEKEIFGPILTVYPFADDKIDDALLLAEKSAYGLTGSIFSNDRFVFLLLGVIFSPLTRVRLSGTSSPKPLACSSMDVAICTSTISRPVRCIR